MSAWQVWRYLLSAGLAKSGARVLELNCGTGEDAVWLARQGCRVLATDISPAMIEVARAKVDAAGLSEQVACRVCRIQDVGQTTGPFDLVFSNFGGLNCVSPADLQHLSQTLKPLLAPGGRFVAVVMGRFCWWESVYFVLKTNIKQAARRWNKQPVQAPLGGGAWIDTWYYSPREFGRFFSAWRVRRVLPVGFWLPPSYLDPLFVRWPRWLRVLAWLERHSRSRLLAAASDHYLIELT